jgi:3-hydroxyacyl-[acyl-carrier-protein] dehydratase
MRIEYFQLIDRITALNLAEHTITTEAAVPATSTIFDGHFPGYPLMPGVLLIESMAQTAGWLIVAERRFESMPFLASLKEVKLRTFVQPGAKLTLFAKLIHDGSGFAVVKAEGKHEGKPICDATITFRVMPFPNAQFRTSMQQVAERLEFPMETVGNG